MSPPEYRAPAASRLTLLGRSYCHLCEEMAAALRPLLAPTDIVLEELDVDAHPELEARYGEDVPVLLAGTEELCRHRLDAARVRAWLSRAT